MYRLFILEGMDSTGKTSLARKITDTYGGLYLHSSGSKPFHDIMQAYHEQQLEIVRENIGHMDVVLDRHWVSEFVYGGVLRPGNQSKYSFTRMQKLVDELNPIYIYCTSDCGYETHVKSHQDQDHVYASITYKIIEDRYARFFERNKHLEYNLQRDGTRMEQIAWQLAETGDFK